MTEAERTDDVSRPSSQRVGIVMAIAAVALIAVWMYLDKRKAEQRTAEAIGQNTELLKKMANMEATIADIKRAEVMESQAAAITRDAVLEVESIGQTAVQRVNELQRVIGDWARYSESLLDGEEGRRIASNPKLAEQFHLTQQNPTDFVQLHRELNARTNALMEPINQALEDGISEFQPNPQIEARLAAIQQEASDAINALMRLKLQSELLAVEAKGEEPNPDLTLRQVIIKLEDTWAKEELRKEQETLAQTRKENAAMVAAAKADAEREIAEAEAAAAKLTGQQTAKDIAERARLAQAKREEEERKRQLEADFAKALPTIRSALQPFLTEGRNFRASGRGPMSLSSIRATGALEDTKTGIGNMSKCVEPFVNDRVRGNDYALNRDYLEQAQALLIKYGEIMVEKGLLDP